VQHFFKNKNEKYTSAYLNPTKLNYALLLEPVDDSHLSAFLKVREIFT